MEILHHRFVDPHLLQQQEKDSLDEKIPDEIDVSAPKKKHTIAKYVLHTNHIPLVSYFIA